MSPDFWDCHRHSGKDQVTFLNVRNLWTEIAVRRLT